MPGNGYSTGILALSSSHRLAADKIYRVTHAATGGARIFMQRATARFANAPDFPDGGVGVRLVRQDPNGTAVEAHSWDEIKNETRAKTTIPKRKKTPGGFVQPPGVFLCYNRHSPMSYSESLNKCLRVFYAGPACFTASTVPSSNCTKSALKNSAK